MGTGRLLSTGLLLGLVVACGSSSPERRAAPSGPPAARVPPASAFAHLERVEPYVPYLERLRRHRTELTVRGPSGGEALGAPPGGATRVTYDAPGGPLVAFLFSPEAAASGPRPGLLYLHNDFALTPLSLRNARPFVEAGFVVLVPTLRGENGQPGVFELLLGEVEDVKAAARFLASRPEVDHRHVYAFGHSIGGGLAALTSLHPDVPLRRSASVGGIYRARTFHSWAARPGTRHLVRFDPNDGDEVTLRLLLPNLRDMVRPHLAYAGREDRFDLAYAEHAAAEAERLGAPLTRVLVAGDHMGSVREASAHFIETVRADLRAGGAP